MTRRSWLAGAVGGVCLAQPAARTQRIEIHLERKKGGLVEQLSPGFVCDNGDLVRFRFKVSFDGYVYVTNLSTSGKYSQLFPNEQTGTENHVENDREYVLPANETGWFRLAEPAGYEMVYWLVTQVRLPERRSGGQPAAPAPLPSAIIPRCDDALFRARGDCIDRAAGVRTIRDAGDMPPPLVGLRPRELDLITAGNTTAVTAQGQGDGPLIYVFRLAHR